MKEDVTEKRNNSLLLVKSTLKGQTSGNYIYNNELYEIGNDGSDKKIKDLNEEELNLVNEFIETFIINSHYARKDMTDSSCTITANYKGKNVSFVNPSPTMYNELDISKNISILFEELSK